MFDPRALELLFTLVGCVALLGLWVAAAAVLPWTDAELDEVARGFAELRGLRRPALAPARVLAREVVPR